MRSTDCREVLDLLSAHLDGELPPGSAARVDEHIACCTGCAGERAAMLETWDALEAWTTEPAPDSFDAKVRARLGASARRLRWTALAAGLLVGLLLGALVPRGKAGTLEYAVSTVGATRASSLDGATLLLFDSLGGSDR